MADFLAREEAPLDSKVWEGIDNVVIESARKRLIGRKFITITGPLGPGAQVAYIPKIGGFDADRVEIKERLNLVIPMIYKDFKLSWRDIEYSKQYGMPLELGPAAVSAAYCAIKEDELIFYGSDEYGYKGLLNSNNSTSVQVLDWKVNGNGFQNVVSAISALSSAGFYGPYAMIFSPSLYAMMHRVYDGTGSLEIEMIRELVTDGIFQTPVIKGVGAVVVATGAENFDLIIAQDLITAYMGPESMDHLFRVFESVLLRIKRPESICVFA